MAFPWTFYENFDDGTRGNFNSANDSGSSLLDFPDYKTLAGSGLSPWQGSHACRIQLNGTATSDIQEDDGLDIGADASLHIWFPILVAENFTLSDTNKVIVLALRASSTDEVVFGIERDGDDYKFFAGETTSTNSIAFNRSNGIWHQIELSIKIDDGGSNDGTIDFYVDGAQVGSQIASLDQGVITVARFGAVSGTDSGDTGTILLGGIIADDARVYPRERFGVDTFWVTGDINAFVGPCTIDSVSLTGTGTDTVMTILDTDVYSSTGISFSREPVVYVRNVVANDLAPGQNLPVQVKKGVYVQLAGTNPQAWVSLKRPSSPIMSSGHYVDRGIRG